MVSGQYSRCILLICLGVIDCLPGLSKITCTSEQPRPNWLRINLVNTIIRHVFMTCHRCCIDQKHLGLEGQWISLGNSLWISLLSLLITMEIIKGPKELYNCSSWFPLNTLQFVYNEEVCLHRHLHKKGLPPVCSSNTRLPECDHQHRQHGEECDHHFLLENCIFLSLLI